MKMTIRDSHASINGDDTEYEMPSGGLDVVGTNGKALFCITMMENGGIHISASSVVKIGKECFDEGLVLHPRASNVIEVTRRKCE